MTAFYPVGTLRGFYGNSPVMHRIYIYHYGTDVKVQFEMGGPYVGMKEQDLPAKIKYAIASRGFKPLRTTFYFNGGKSNEVKPDVAVNFEAKEFNELAAQLNVFLKEPAKD